MSNFKMPKPIKRPTSENYWIRKKVPLVGKTELWATLGTKDERQGQHQDRRRQRGHRGSMGPPA
ncbi:MULTISPECIES: hypothetical protein [Bradyrhizobium]|uniref:Integrase n=3 Tax=Bradyrhizobium TaxID=374 RepID=A0A410VJ51_9BRAD|nr:MULTISPECIES: hypothetical protein [Bradyrhizobium]MCG2629413.1 hypothetical protein [Bradyrhizobium zhengyangense]MCG2644960.1 hypothetical protein [Bradyrhizobium zhengyangense]MCG2670927.1 hypothetical protein [Bradyrhizobium zhengyangense]MDN4984560.1 hypothetical protein [Bradyrhizobium sp. WYCCWR 13022]MDN5002552.1 hypothetical protein [Bradyrhizobium sp. WYCCWR 12677]